MQYYPKDHPVWTILTHSVYLGFATLFMWLNASNFDSTEWVTIGQMAGAFGGVELLKSKLGKSS
jgi:hypothetical protein